MSTMICRIGRLGRARDTDTKGDATPASPSAPTRFKKPRRRIVFAGVPGEKLFFDLLGVTECWLLIGFIVVDFLLFSGVWQGQLWGVFCNCFQVLRRRAVRKARLLYAFGPGSGQEGRPR